MCHRGLYASLVTVIRKEARREGKKKIIRELSDEWRLKRKYGKQRGTGFLGEANWITEPCVSFLAISI